MPGTGHREVPKGGLPDELGHRWRGSTGQQQLHRVGETVAWLYFPLIDLLPCLCSPSHHWLDLSEACRSQCHGAQRECGRVWMGVKAQVEDNPHVADFSQFLQFVSPLVFSRQRSVFKYFSLLILKLFLGYFTVQVLQCNVS